MPQKFDGAPARRRVWRGEMKTVGLGQQPMQPDDFDPRPPRNSAHLRRTPFVDPPRVFIQSKRRNLHAAVIAGREIAANPFERPADVRFVAKGELHGG